jgi:predicted Zn-dependent protease
MYGSNGWITSGTVYLNRSYSQDERGEAHVTSREIGHALGLAATDDRRAIMYAGPNDPWYRWCQPADLVELDGLYP